ncbi:MAG: FAD-dependent oxidoreductase [Spirochaetes bacterium]|nr:FAD-dependent oxidoreductase [Spirochaetota bacterium]
MEHLVIVGGVAAGLGAAAQARRIDPKIKISVFEKTPYVSYGLCSLSFFLKGDIKNIQDLFIHSVSYFKEKRDIDVFTRHFVQKLDTEKKKIVVIDNTSFEEKHIPYSKILIATGARARVPEIPGVELKNIFTFRDIQSVIDLKEYIKKEKPGKCAIIGGGLIGLTVAEALKAFDIDILLVDSQNYIPFNFSHDMAQIVSDELRKNRIKLLVNSHIDAFLGKDKIEKISIDGKLYSIDFAVLTTGVIPDTELALSADIELSLHKAIKVNNRMQTSKPHVYAAGDCTHSFHFLTGKEIYLPLATITDKQAQIAASNMTGLPRLYKGSIGTVLEKVFSLQIARTGLTEQQIMAQGYNYISETIHGRSRAGYFPGAEEIVLKLFINKNDNKILGAEMIGREGVAKRIDILGCAIYAGLTLHDLYNIDFAYTPPFSPSRDVIWTAAAKLM